MIHKHSVKFIGRDGLHKLRRRQTHRGPGPGLSEALKDAEYRPSGALRNLSSHHPNVPDVFVPCHPTTARALKVALHTLQTPRLRLTRHRPRHGISSIYDTHVTLVVELMARIVAPYGIRVSSRLCGCIQIRAAATHPLHPRSISLVTYKCFEQYVSARRILDPEARAAPCPIVRPRVSQDNIHYAPSIVRECFFPPRPSFPPLHTCLLMEPSTRRPVIQTPGGPRLATSL